jgi:hypothetical protein
MSPTICFLSVCKTLHWSSFNAKVGHSVVQIHNLGVEIDFGPDQPGAILQREYIHGWRDYLVDDAPVTKPFDVEMLPPGRYRLRDPA